MSLTINIRKNKTRVVLELSGSLTVGEDMAPLRESIRNELAKGARGFDLDVSRLSHIDSRGLGELVSMSVDVQNKGGSVKLIRLNSRSNQVLEMTKLTTVLGSATHQEFRRNRLALTIVIAALSLLTVLIVYILSK
jgi:anti-anti-sigma factor